MTLLVLNCGSATIKFQAFAVTAGDPVRLLRGSIPIGKSAAQLEMKMTDGTESARSVSASTHADALAGLFSLLTSAKSAGGLELQLTATCHRIVHGGSAFTAPARIDDAVIAKLHELERLAPLHNGPGVAGIRAAVKTVPGIHIAVFDTAFHHTMPEVAWRYALPYEMAERHGIRRFGFHGSSYRYVVDQLAKVTRRAPEEITAVILHLGNGASAAAIRKGKGVDTTMGFTPLEGLVMGTRSGDLDPGLFAYLMDRERLSPDELERVLYRESGLLGVSGLSHDMRILLDAEATHRRARVAVDLFCYRARKTVGALMAAVDGADLLVFTGGIGENSPEIRERICGPLDWLGVQLDRKVNFSFQNNDLMISPQNARTQVWVIPTDEELQIARESLPFLL